MKKIALTLGVLATVLVNAQSIKTTIDLVNVKDDKVAVTMEFPKMKSGDVKFHFPKTVPGTYSVDDYGRFIEGIKFLDNKGKELTFTKVNDNTYSLKNAQNLNKITYLVNDSFDDEMDTSKHKAVFSPSGTDIEEGKIYLINTHGFVGYIDNMQDVPYQLVIQKPNNFYGTTALVDQDKSEATDTYTLANYAKLTDSPLMYTKPDYITFNAGGMDLVLGVYSPTGKYKASDFKENLEKMVIAQKKFLGDMNTNKKYAIMLYLSGDSGPQIKGFGALEHHESTSVVLPEFMPKEAIDKTITDVVSHEFFHTVNPLKTHSEEIHYFDYADPKMSQHLWMYEGGTEYFANLFQIQEGLINKDEFLHRINEKITNSKNYDDTMPFTVMSKNILLDQYKDQYRNVYEKGALLTMCLDIELRKLSNGEMGYRDMIRKLSQRFGENKPFKDDKLIDELVAVTGYPQIRDFYTKYIAGSQPTPYAEYLNMVGVEVIKQETPPIFWFIKDPNQTGFDEKNNAFAFDESSALSPFSKSIGFKITDQVFALDGKTIDIKNVQSFINYAKSIKEGQNVTVTVLRQNGDKLEKIDLKGKAVLDKMTVETLQYKANPTPAEQKLQNQWLTGKK
ncbi:peptidase M61 [Chryseobacterium sp. Alg-005]|uniref:M61 family metallopeptidase n=1 Tax=Chryseobacterium sp. Alg-005 TaxID=3159516 RepID=UPI003555BAF2